MRPAIGEAMVANDRSSSADFTLASATFTAACASRIRLSRSSKVLSEMILRSSSGLPRDHVEVGVLHLGGGGKQLGLGLLQRALEGPRIDDKQQIALLDDLPVLEAHLVEVARNARAHLDGLDGVEPARVFVPFDDVALRRLGHADDRRPRLDLLLRCLRLALVAAGKQQGHRRGKPNAARAQTREPAFPHAFTRGCQGIYARHAGEAFRHQPCRLPRSLTRKIEPAQQSCCRTAKSPADRVAGTRRAGPLWAGRMQPSVSVAEAGRGRRFLSVRCGAKARHGTVMQSAREPQLYCRRGRARSRASSSRRSSRTGSSAFPPPPGRPGRGLLRLGVPLGRRGGAAGSWPAAATAIRAGAIGAGDVELAVVPGQPSPACFPRRCVSYADDRAGLHVDDSNLLHLLGSPRALDRADMEAQHADARKRRRLQRPTRGCGALPCPSSRCRPEERYWRSLRGDELASAVGIRASPRGRHRHFSILGTHCDAQPFQRATGSFSSRIEAQRLACRSALAAAARPCASWISPRAQ